MLNVWMYQGYRCFSQSGTQVRTTSRIISSGGSSSAPATMKTIAGWKTRRRLRWNERSCETDASTARAAKRRHSIASTLTVASRIPTAAGTTTAAQ